MACRECNEFIELNWVATTSLFLEIYVVRMKSLIAASYDDLIVHFSKNFWSADKKFAGKQFSWKISSITEENVT